MRTIKAKLRIVECEELDKSAALNNTQEQLLLMSEQQSHASLHLQDLEVSETVTECVIQLAQITVLLLSISRYLFGLFYVFFVKLFDMLMFKCCCVIVTAKK